MKTLYIPLVVFTLFNDTALIANLPPLEESVALWETVEEKKTLLEQLIEQQGYIELKKEGVVGGRYKLYAIRIKSISIHLVPKEGAA